MATTVYDVEEIQLQNGATVKLKPLTIKELRKFMKVIQKTQEVTSEDETLTILIEACAVALEKQLPELVKDKDAFEDTLDVPTINRIQGNISSGVSPASPALRSAINSSEISSSIPSSFCAIGVSPGVKIADLN